MLMRINQVNNFIQEQGIQEYTSEKRECKGNKQNIEHDTYPHTNKPTILSHLMNKHNCFVILSS